MKSFLFLFLLLAQFAFAATPVQLKNEAGTSRLDASVVVTPNSQATKISDKTYRIETGNKNLLKDPSFEGGALSDWVVDSTYSAASISTTTSIEGKKSLSILTNASTFSNVTLLSQTFTADKEDFYGRTVIGSITLKRSVNDAYLSLWLCIDTTISGTTYTNCNTIKSQSTNWETFAVYIPGNSTANAVYKFYLLAAQATATAHQFYVDDTSFRVAGDLKTAVPDLDSVVSDLNYLDNGGFEKGLSGWYVYNDSSGAMPSTCSGTTAATLTLAGGIASGSGTFSGSSSAVINHPSSSSQGEGVAKNFAIDKAARGKIGIATFPYEILAGTYYPGTSTTDSDLAVYLYDVDGAQLIQPNGYKLDSTAGEVRAEFAFPWFTSTTRNMRLCIHSATTNTNFFSLNFDKVFVKQQGRVQGAFISGLTDYGTLTITATTTAPTKGTTTVDLIQAQRIGDQMHVVGGYKQTAAGSNGSGDYLIQLPTGYAFDSNKVSYYTAVVGLGSAPTAKAYGTATSTSVGANQFVGAIVPYDSTHFRLCGLVAGTPACIGQSSYGGLANTTNSLSFDFMAPLAGAGVTQTLSSDSGLRPVLAYGAMSGTGVSGSYSIATLTATKDSHGCISSNVCTIPEPGDYDLSAWWTNNTSTLYGKSVAVYIDGALVYQMTNTGPVGYSSGPSLKYRTPLKAGQKVSFYFYTGTTTNTMDYGQFSIEKIGTGSQQIAAAEPVYAGAYLSASASVAAGAVIPYDGKIEDSHGALTLGASFRFTAPASGLYSITGIVNYNVSDFPKVYVSGGTATRPCGAGASGYVTLSCDIRLLAGQYIDIRPSNAGTAAGSASTTTVSYIYIKRTGL